MATVIGYQDGITAGVNGLRDLDPSKTLLKKVPNEKGKLEWQPLSVLASTPFDQWKAWDKYERMLRILKDDHDAAIGGGSPDPPDPPPVQTYVRVAPRATNAEGGANVQYCMYEPNSYTLRPGITDLGGDNFRDESGATYHEALQTSSIRDEGYRVDGLPGSRGMDGRSPCQCLADAGYPGDPEKNTGAWHI